MAGKVLSIRLLAFFAAFLIVGPAMAEDGSRYGNIPLSFEKNHGQTDPSVLFLARASGFGLFLTQDEAVLSLTRPDGQVRMRLEGKNADARIDGLDQLSGVSRYFIGRDAGQWRGEATQYGKVRYSDVYPGIDLIYYGNQRHIEFDFVVSAAADPSVILMAFEGADSIRIDASGDLVLTTEAGAELRQKKPIIYQDIEGSRVPVEGAYELRGKDVGFRLEPYDATRPLVIDPVLVYSTYVGGFASGGVGDRVMSVAVDPAGNAYLTGFTASINFPAGASLNATPGGGLDAFILKLNASGDNTHYSTYIGGTADDEGHSIALDAQGNIFVTGYTSSSDFPVANAFRSTRAGNQDAFILKLNNSGTVLLFSTFLGGSGDDRGLGLAVDAGGSVYVTGMTTSTNFPTVNPLQATHGGGLGDIFVTKLTPAGAAVYSTYYGGRGHDQGYAIVVDGSASPYITGYTTSTNFPVANAYQNTYRGGADDALLLKLNTAGTAVVFSTYLGGFGSDNGVRLALDREGSIYVAGYTASEDFPVLNPAQSINLGSFDAFVTKFAPDGASLVYSTFMGGLGSEGAVGIAVDASGSAYITGFSTSFELPAVNAIQLRKSGDQDAFLIKFTPDGTKFLYSTYLGGTALEGGIGLTLDSPGNIYITGYSTSSDFPVANPLQPENAGGSDGFIVKIDASDVRDAAPFGIVSQGLGTIGTAGNNDEAVFGYALADVSSGPALRTGLAMISLDALGGIVSEIGVQAPPLISEGRFFVEVATTLRSAVSIANHTAEDVTFEFYFTDKDGVSSLSGTETISAGKMFSRFVSDPPFNIPLDSEGTLSIHASVPLAIAAFGTNATQESNLLLYNSPVAEIRIGDNRPAIIPQFANGQGWDTRIVLFNPTEDRMNGEIRFFAANSGEPGSPAEVGIDSGTSSVYEFDIPGRSFQDFQTSGVAENVQIGWVEVVPFSTSRTPAAHAILTHTHDGVTASKTTVNGLKPSAKLRLLAEASGDFDAAENLSTRTAIAIANPGNTAATVRLELLAPDGRPSGTAATLTLPPQGHMASFLHEIAGFELVTTPYQSVLEVSTTSPSGVSVLGMRGKYNQLGRFIATTTGPLTENGGTASSLIFPHIAEGDGYTTQFVLVGGTSGQGSSGILRLVDQEGQPLKLTLR
jgi:hypothetical protein